MGKILEEWRPVMGYEGYYEVSNFGSLRSMTRSVVYKDGGTRVWTGRRLNPTLCPQGYYRTTLSKNGVNKTQAVHRLVAKAFIPLVEGKEHINHKDSNRANNRVSNLEWCTPQENARHGATYGNMQPKTHCKNGHRLDPDNVYVYEVGGFRPNRQCKTCLIRKNVNDARKRKLAKEARKLALSFIEEDEGG